MNCFWIENTERTLKELRRKSQGVVVLPLGSIEAHGPHLPVGSDTFSADDLARRVAKCETVAILPTLAYNFVAEARMLLGAIHVPSSLLTAFIMNICEEVYRNGFDKIVLLHCHGGNVCLHQQFLKEVHEQEKPYSVYSIPVFGGREAEIKGMMKQKPDGHGGEFETSTNLASNPALVNLGALGGKGFTTYPRPDIGAAVSSVEWVSQHPLMAVGRPQNATKETGEIIYKIWTDETVSILRKIKKDKLGPSVVRSYNKRVRGLRATV